MRLSKRLAEQISCSRREAEIYIEGGFVTVDGKVIEEPQFRVGEQVIALSPDAVLTGVEAVTLLVHQVRVDSVLAPAIIGPENHDDDDLSGIPLLKRHFAHQQSVLPLEENAVGLVVMTQDWRVQRKLVDNAATVEQEYVVDVTGDLSGVDLKALDRRISMNGRELPQAKVSMQNETRLRIAVKGPRPGQIAFLCGHAGLNAVAIKRIRIGRIAMGKLPAGQWRYLPADEKF